MVRSGRASIVAFAALALFAAPVFAGVDAEVPLKAGAKGTILPAGEVETFRFAAAAGTAVTFTATPKKGSGLALAAELRDPDGEVVDLGPGAVVGGKVAVKGLVLALSGTYTLRLSGAGTGEYSFSLSGKPLAKDGETLSFALAGTLPFTFAAPAGARVTLVAKAAPGSAATPRFGQLTGDGFEVDLSGEGKIATASHAVTVPGIGGTGGDLSVEVDNGSPAGGEVLVSVAVRPAKVKKAKLDLRGSILGRPSGGETLLARTVDATGGTVAVDDPGSDLDGAAVDIPPGAFDVPTLVTIRSSPPVIPGTDAGRQASGAAVDLGPSGTTFAGEVTVTLPFDLSLVPADADPQDLKVLVIEDNGTSTVVDDPSVDEGNGTVTLQANGFSVCVPFSVPGIVRIGLQPGGDEYWAMGVGFYHRPDVSGDSRERENDLQLGEAALYGDGTFQVSVEDRTIRYADAASSSTFASSADAEVTPGTYAVESNGQTILFTPAFDPVEPRPPFRMAATRDARYMAGRREDPAESETSHYLFLRKHPEPLTVASLEGTWHGVGEEIVYGNIGSDGALGIEVMRMTGALTFDGAGEFSATSSRKRVEIDALAGVTGPETKSDTQTGTYAVDPDGTVILSFEPHEPGEEGDVIRVFPGDGLDVMFLADDEPCGECIYFGVFVRQAEGFDESLLGSGYRGATLEVEPGLYGPPGAAGPDLSTRAEALSLDFDADGDFAATGTVHEVRRDSGQPGGLEVADEAVSVAAKWSADAKGKVTISSPGASNLPVMFFTPSGEFGALVTSTSSNSATFLVGFFVNPPPPKD